MSRGWLSRYRVAGRVNMRTGYWTETLKESRKREEEELRAMASVNLVFLLGNLGGDPDLKYTQSGKAFCKFSLATSDQWTDTRGEKQEKVEWHRITVWGTQAEHCKKYLTKGSSVHIQGRIATNKWKDEQGQDRFSTEVIAERITFVGRRREGEPPEPQHEDPSFRYRNA